jgi:hypothetical protein
VQLEPEHMQLGLEHMQLGLELGLNDVLVH